jgi:hypothetical protein
VNFTRAFSYIFDDRQWPNKLGITLLVTAAALLLTPVIIGLGLWMILLGYQSDLVRNWRAGVPNPLPRWGQWETHLRVGANILGATLVYNLPNILLTCCVGFIAPSMGATFTGAGISLISICCVIPLLLAYNCVAWPMLALGMALYQDERNIGVYFQFNRLFGLARQYSDLTLRYVLWSAVAGLALGLLSATVVGLVASLALSIPVIGALMGQYTVRIVGKPRLPPPRIYR